MAGCQLLIVQKLLARSFLTSKKLSILRITLFYLRRSHFTSKILHHSLFFFFNLTNRSQYVFLNKASSSKGLLRYGVSHGSVLGPLLFCISINDLPLHISNDKVSNNLFADDSSLHIRGKNIQLVETTLQGNRGEGADWCGSNSMIINPAEPKKKKSMVIATRQKHQLSPLSSNSPLKRQTLSKYMNIVSRVSQ